ncbi:hypothetical protein SKAU_G00037000 [Synaphobranchus kaupii]|uniref:Uncharacterized protein n=1 Tax=Synaphobranchus kaupii TaxID=118154 RepID=A0A9Q1GH99_SYNKA|nr:hypothetical protein SKAU_G00037000 [Synaphobranchus kaupii]
MSADLIRSQPGRFPSSASEEMQMARRFSAAARQRGPRVKPLIRLSTAISEGLSRMQRVVSCPAGAMLPIDFFIRGISGMLPMFLVLAFMFSVCLTVKGLVLEKELRLKEVLRAVGVRNGVLWLACFIENFVLLTVPCALISVMVKVSVDQTKRLG